jgi:DGQHR domain-containing protein
MELTYAKSPCLQVKLGQIPAYIFMMRVNDLHYIKYIAVRGRDNEEGAVQRVLSPIRLKSIEEYVLNGNTFYTPFFLNWTNQEQGIKVENGIISVPLVPNSAQVIDGQHRLAGLERAMKKDPKVDEQEVMVVLSNLLNTKEAASVFLNINTEQKPVPKSLIYDLFGEINDNKELPLVRAKDIALALQTDEKSPYLNSVKMPGSMRGVGIIDLSTIVNSIRPLLEDDGAFKKYRLTNLENQVSTVLNYFNAIKAAYMKKDMWYSKTSNPFLTNAGFIAAADVLNKTIIPKCVENKDFTQENMERLLKLDDTSILLRADLKNVDGKMQRKMIANYLEGAINNDIPDEDAYKF